MGAEGCACTDGSACDPGLSCQEGACLCLETNEAFCESMNAVCGDVVGTDSCGNLRQVTCGDCGSATCDDESHRCVPSCAGVSIDDGFLEDNVDNGNWQPIAGINNSEHDLFVTATPDLQVIVSFQASLGCSDRALRVFEYLDGSYAASDITEELASEIYFEEHTMTITPEGDALIGMRPDRARLVLADRALLQAGDLNAIDGDPTLLLEVNGAAALMNATFDAPLLSPDGLTLYYLLAGGVDVTGFYEARRPALDAAFPAGVRLTGVIDSYWYITGVSFDGLSLFVEKDWDTWVLHREHASLPFEGPDPVPEEMLTSGFRVMPTNESCTAFVGNGPTIGCSNEEIVVYP